MYKVNIKSMSIENYIKFFNEALYPINYPYHLRYGLRSMPELSIIIQIHIDNDENNKPYFKDILEIKGDSDEEVVEKMEDIKKVWIDTKKLEDYKSLWNM